VQRVSTLHICNLYEIHATGWLSVWLSPYSFASLSFDNFAEYYLIIFFIIAGL